MSADRGKAPSGASPSGTVVPRKGGQPDPYDPQQWSGGRSWLGVSVAVTAATLLTAGVVWAAVDSLSGNRYAPWILGRASGITTYLLLVALVVLGMLLSHPRRARWRVPSTPVRIALHVGLAAFTLFFLILHVVVLATDSYAQVGWAGAFLPMASTYRPVPVTLGVVSMYAGLLTGLTGLAAGRWARRVWWPIHKVAALTWVLAWLHGVFAGADTSQLWWLYALTGLLVAAVGAARYLTSGPADAVAAMAAR